MHGHILDPRTGRPAPDLGLAAAMCDSGVDAEAWSTAVLVLGARPKNLDRSIDTILLPASTIEHLR